MSSTVDTLGQLRHLLAGPRHGSRILEVSGVEAEQEFVFAALQQACGRLLDHLDRIPDSKRKRCG